MPESCLAAGRPLTEIAEIKADKDSKRYLKIDLWDQRDLAWGFSKVAHCPQCTLNLFDHSVKETKQNKPLNMEIIDSWFIHSFWILLLAKKTYHISIYVRRASCLHNETALRSNQYILRMAYRSSVISNPLCSITVRNEVKKNMKKNLCLRQWKTLCFFRGFSFR